MACKTHKQTVTHMDMSVSISDGFDRASVVTACGLWLSQETLAFSDCDCCMSCIVDQLTAVFVILRHLQLLPRQTYTNNFVGRP